MRQPLLVLAAIAIGFGTAGCSKKTEDAAKTAVDAAASDAATNAAKAGDAVAGAAKDVGAKASKAADDIGDHARTAGKSASAEASEAAH